jgi:hypothetical protein
MHNLGPRIFRVTDESRGEKTAMDLKYVVTLTRSISERLGLFGVVFGAFALSQDRSHRHTIQGGVTLLLTHIFQLDVRAGAAFGVRLPR